jgi:hypothetical protein
MASRPVPGLAPGEAHTAAGFGEPATTNTGECRSIWAAPWAVPAAGEQTVVVQTSYGLVPIGWVQSALRVLDDAPNQREGAPRAWIRFDEQVAEGAKDLRAGDEIVVLTWLHLSPRDELSTHPEDDMSQPLTAPPGAGSTALCSTCGPPGMIWKTSTEIRSPSGATGPVTCAARPSIAATTSPKRPQRS